MNNKGPLKYVAALILTVMAVVPFTGMDSLPRELRSKIDSERAALTSAQSSVRAAQQEVARELQSEPDLYRSIASSSTWQAVLGQSDANLQSASREMEQLNALQKQNRRGDRAQAEALLSHEQEVRSTALSRAVSVQKDAAHWIDLKKRLPDVVQQMDRDYQAIHAFDLASTAAVVSKAEADWPEKQADLDARLAALRSKAGQADTIWQSSAAYRREAAAGNYAGVDFGALFGAADGLHTTAVELPAKSTELAALSGQLYTTWDKILVDMEERNRSFQEKVRIVTTKGAETKSDEKWVEVSRAQFDSLKPNLGMAIEHKPAGKYDSEAERTAQPAGFAYMAPPSQGRNQYGYWDHRDGRDFWVFYGQYALMRDLLFNRDYRPLYRGEYEDYRGYQSRGQTYYGRDESTASAPKYGTQGSATQNRYSGSTFAKSGGFNDSKYKNQSGSYNGSKYATPGGDRTPRSFGSGTMAGVPRPLLLRAAASGRRRRGPRRGLRVRRGGSEEDSIAGRSTGVSTRQAGVPAPQKPL